ncbi:4Fe-4S binding protein [Candidatus Poribacteria bacterium]|nr:4Fe-4S binding protein [Candidatus Poribacteria bacterium]
MEKPIDLKSLKSGGFMKQRQKDKFSVRVKVPVGIIEADQVAKISEVAKKYGHGYIHLTTRQAIEIPWVDFSKFEEVKNELAAVGLAPGSCGPRVRNVVACPGSHICTHGLLDTQKFGLKIDKEFFGKDYPVKIKIAATGCPNSCAKPQENDIGIMAVVLPELDKSLCSDCGLCIETCKEGAIYKDKDGLKLDKSKCTFDGDCILNCPMDSWKAGKLGYNVFIGGKIGRKPQLGHIIAEFVHEDDVLKLMHDILNYFIKNYLPGERIGDIVNRIGIKKIKKDLNYSV